MLTSLAKSSDFNERLSAKTFRSDSSIAIAPATSFLPDIASYFAMYPELGSSLVPKITAVRPAGSPAVPLIASARLFCLDSS